MRYGLWCCRPFPPKKTYIKKQASEKENHKYQNLFTWNRFSCMVLHEAFANLYLVVVRFVLSLSRALSCESFFSLVRIFQMFVCVSSGNGRLEFAVYAVKMLKEINNSINIMSAASFRNV